LDINTGFNDVNLVVFDDDEKLKEFLLAQNWANKNLLLMSSGNYNNINTKELSMKIVG
jgi:UDP-N-acetylmuramate: L-alanyl-gamma-D-glutamyl-meso-diaminopimelate ligase